MTGSVFNIQRFSTHDGPGIRTTVFLKGCPLRCFWCQNPESQSLRPVLLFQQENCTACGGCVPVCPTGANEIRDGCLHFEREKCSVCGCCVDACLLDLRSVAGKEMTVDEVMAVVLRDRAMYANSGGGMTLSGGEVTLQSDFALALLKRAREEGLHTAIETCGYCDWEVLERLLEYTDMVMYDLKCIDSDHHKAGTGVENKRILENAVKVAQRKNTLFRMPLIPGYNDRVEYVRAMAEFVRDKTGLDKSHIELLPYNNLGEEKFRRLGRDGPSLSKQSDGCIEELNAVVASVFES